jgi:CRISPR-associated exonuclease Cas4
VRIHTCPVRFYYEQNAAVQESDRYAVCKQLSYHLGSPLDAEAIWAEITTVRPAIDPAMKEFLGICIASCKKREWAPATETDVRVFSKKHALAGMIDSRDRRRDVLDRPGIGVDADGDVRRRPAPRGRHRSLS